MIICLEGVDAAGKATQASRLASAIGGMLFSFPDYTTPFGAIIKGHLTHEWHCSPHGKPQDAKEMHLLNAKVFQALQAANRMERAAWIREQAKLTHVVFDRYWPSGYVYGMEDGLDGQWLIDLHKDLPQPDLFLLLDIDPELSIERRPERRDRYEERPGMMEKVAAGYLDFWAAQRQKDPGKWRIIDGELSKDEIAAGILAIVKEFIP